MASLLYDAECFFCMVITDGLLSWDRAGRLHAVSIQSEEGQRLLAPVPAEQRLDSFHLVEEGVVSGGPALPELLRRLPGGAPPAGLLDRLPGVTDGAYEWIAGHRVQISRFVPGRLKARAARRLDPDGAAPSPG